MQSHKRTIQAHIKRIQQLQTNSHNSNQYGLGIQIPNRFEAPFPSTQFQDSSDEDDDYYDDHVYRSSSQEEQEEDLRLVEIRQQLLKQENRRVSALQIHRLPDVQIKDREGACSICLNQWKLNQNVKALPCLHKYHQQCIKDWLFNKNTCPLCKKCVF